MAFSDVTVPYEILIRCDVTGTATASHIQRRRIVTVDGVRLVDEVLPAEPLELSDVAAFLPDNP